MWWNRDKQKEVLTVTATSIEYGKVFEVTYSGMSDMRNYYEYRLSRLEGELEGFQSLSRDNVGKVRSSKTYKNLQKAYKQDVQEFRDTIELLENRIRNLKEYREGV